MGPSQAITSSTLVDPHFFSGCAAIVIALVLLLVYFYRRRPFILWWMTAWVLLSASMGVVAGQYAAPQLGRMAYGLSQFLGILSSLAFVVAADAYRQPPRLQRWYGLALLPVAIWFTLAPAALGEAALPAVVFAPGQILIAGGMAAAAVAHLLLLRQANLLGAAVIGVALLALAGLNAWLAAAAIRPEPATVATGMIAMTVVFLVIALGMQLMAFEDMTYELQRTNRRLESIQGELREAVVTDPLTGCRNRRFFDEVIGRELERHRRYSLPLSIVFIDIDRFKAINDTLGHEMGDRVLRQVASFLLSNIREADYVFRWGGDEFLVLISCGEEEAVRRAAALERTFDASTETAGLPPGVALSFGCMQVPANTTDIMPLVQAADERMYVDKKRGR